MHWPAATAEPEPLLEPPGMWSRFQGLRAKGKEVVGSGPPRAHSYMDSLPRSTVPAPLSLATVVACSVGIRSLSTLEPAVGPDPRCVVQVFQGDGYAVERSLVVTSEDFCLGGLCLCQALVPQHGDKGVKPILRRFDAVEEGARKLHRGQLPGLNQLAGLPHGQVVQAGLGGTDGSPPPCPAMLVVTNKSLCLCVLPTLDQATGSPGDHSEGQSG